MCFTSDLVQGHFKATDNFIISSHIEESRSYLSNLLNHLIKEQSSETVKDAQMCQVRDLFTLVVVFLRNKIKNSLKQKCSTRFKVSSKLTAKMSYMQYNAMLKSVMIAYQ